MKWFKHLSGSLNDSFIFELVEKFGGDGYLVFFGTIEAMTDEFDIFNPGKNRFLIKKLTKNFQLSRQKTVKIWKFCDEKAKESKKKEVSFFASINENYIELYCPRLKDLTDEYTDKQLKKLSGQTPDQIPIVSGQTPEQEAETEAEADIKKKDIQRPAVTPALLFPLKDGTEYPLELAKISQYEKTYHNIDVQFELKKCLQWDIDHVDERKTERGILKHINFWLSRASNSKGPSIQPGIEGDGTAVEEARKDRESYDPKKTKANIERINKMGLTATKGI